MSRTQDYAGQMQEWPDSWAIIDEDIPIGKRVVAEMLPFVAQLAGQRTPKTLRRHLHYLNLLGGKIIGDLNYDHNAKDREKSGRDLILDQVEEFCGPIYRHVPEQEQHLFDCTCKKFHRFLQASIAA